MRKKPTEVAKEIWDLTRGAFVSWDRDNAFQLAAAMAFYAVFSAAPLVIIAMAIAGSVFGEKAASGQIAVQVENLVGKAGAQVIEVVLANARVRSHFATFLGIVTLIFCATTVFAYLHGALNQIWNVPAKPGGAVRLFIKKRLLSFAMVLISGFLLLVSLITTTALSAVMRYMPELFRIPNYILYSANFLLSLALGTLVFGICYKILPDVQLFWRDIWIGAAVTSFLFTIGKLLIGFYLGHSSLGSSYGAAGSFLVLLVWVYYSAQVFFFGAEFTKVYILRHSSIRSIQNKELT